MKTDGDFAVYETSALRNYLAASIRKALCRLGKSGRGCACCCYDPTCSEMIDSFSDQQMNVREERSKGLSIA